MTEARRRPGWRHPPGPTAGLFPVTPLARRIARSRLAGLGLASLGFAAACLFSPGSARPAAAASFDVIDAAPPERMMRPRLQVDAGTRLGPSGPEAILALEVPYSELFFRPAGSRWEALFDVIMVLYRDDMQVGGDLWTEAITVDSRSEAESRRRRHRRSVVIPAEPGRYEAEVILRETAAGRETIQSWDLTVPDYAAEPLSISSLWIADCVAADADTTANVPPPGWVLNRRLGQPLSRLCVRGEIYQEDAAASRAPVRLRWRIRGARGDEVQKGDLTLGAGARLAFRFQPDFGALWLGDHTLEVEATVGDLEARRRMDFQVEETSAAFSSDLEQSLDLVGLIADDEEIAQLRDALPAERQDAWERFWKRRDPTPATPENEFRDEFFSRVRYANEHYSVLGPGWRSDRGRTYIRYGPPDQIETQSYNLDGPPYEVWVYQRLGRRFVFVDYDGFGRYEFYQPGRS